MEYLVTIFLTWVCISGTNCSDNDLRFRNYCDFQEIINKEVIKTEAAPLLHHDLFSGTNGLFFLSDKENE